MFTMDASIYLNSIDLLKFYNDYISISDLGIIVSGTSIDTITLENTWDGGERFHFYAGNPDDENENYEELVLSDSEQETVLQKVLVYF